MFAKKVLPIAGKRNCIAFFYRKIMQFCENLPSIDYQVSNLGASSSVAADYSSGSVAVSNWEAGVTIYRGGNSVPVGTIAYKNVNDVTWLNGGMHLALFSSPNNRIDIFETEGFQKVKELPCCSFSMQDKRDLRFIYFYDRQTKEIVINNDKFDEIKRIQGAQHSINSGHAKGLEALFSAMNGVVYYVHHDKEEVRTLDLNSWSSGCSSVYLDSDQSLFYAVVTEFRGEENSALVKIDLHGNLLECIKRINPDSAAEFTSNNELITGKGEVLNIDTGNLEYDFNW